MIGQDGAESGRGLDEVIALPERRPRQHQQEQPHLDEERDEDETANQGTTPVSESGRGAVRDMAMNTLVRWRRSEQAVQAAQALPASLTVPPARRRHG
jgi:hypothetical protein